MLSAATASLLAGQVLADTDISKQVTSPQTTSQDGNITIESDGSIEITTSPPTGAAVTINSDNALVNNEGTISYKGVTNATGIQLTSGYTGEFESSSVVDLTGTGTAKTGILIQGVASNINSGTFTGLIPAGATSPVAIDLATGSTMKVQGDSSFGIRQ